MYTCKKCKEVCGTELQARMHYYRKHEITLTSYEVKREFSKSSVKVK